MHRHLATTFLCFTALSVGASAQAASTRQIVDTYAQSFIASGQTVGVGVAVINGKKKPRIFTYGDAIAPVGSTPAKSLKANSLFEIGSVTKVFTTNLLGQAVVSGDLDLDTRLSMYKTQLGKLKRKMSKVTLKELADFTGGITDYAPLCSSPNPPPGCLPSNRPTIQQYNGSDFAAYFASAKPMNYNTSPASATKLPAPYFYSDYGVGLLGLLLAGKDKPLANSALRGWNKQVNKKILQPLRMRNTYLKVPETKQKHLVGGYSLALAQADITSGAISAVNVVSRGGSYSSAPPVSITGGGGTGATAEAVLGGEEVDHINVTNGGSGYIAPAQVIFTNGGSTETALAHAIITNGQVAGIVVTKDGSGYQQTPTVTITGGRVGGVDATATAHVVNGRIAYITVDTPGLGYVAPLAVSVGPGDPIENTIPIWAPAGSLTTNLNDMAKFSQAALGLPGKASADLVRQGFEIAEQAYACTGSNPKLGKCPDGSMQSGLAWAVQPKDKKAGVPVIVSKDGGLGGFSTYVALMPSLDLGVVVFVNSRQSISGDPTAVAAKVANNILYALFDKQSAKGTGSD